MQAKYIRVEKICLWAIFLSFLVFFTTSEFTLILIFNFACRNSLLLQKAHHTPRDVAPLILALLGQNEISAVLVLTKVLSDGTDKDLKVMVLIQS